MALTKFDPRIGKLKLPKLKLELVNDSLVAIVGKLQMSFPITIKAKIQWVSQDKTKVGSKPDDVELVWANHETIKIHYILGHPKVPEDVRECAVFLGILLHYAAIVQKKPEQNLLDHPDVAEWIDKQMLIMPAAQFLALFINRFKDWVARL